MAFHKFIVTHSWSDVSTKYGNAFLLKNDSSCSMDAYLQMLAEAKKDFPELKPTDVECRTVVASNWCKGFMCMRFSVVPDMKVPGWRNCAMLPDIVVS